MPDRAEADAPPVRRVAELPDDLRALAQGGLAAWQASELGAASADLEMLLSLARDRHDRDAELHALHLLGCVRFSERRLEESRSLHEQALAIANELAFLGGAASSLFDIGMIDEAVGDKERAMERYRRAYELFERGGYAERLPVVQAAIDAL